MSAPVLANPCPQFCDANGKPYAGGSLATYAKGTTAPKQTWRDPDQVAVNTNPITLDGAGRCVMFGDGDYRMVLTDAQGNLIWDQPSTTAISAAMYPVVSAPTLSGALDTMGVTAAIQAEATARAAQDNNLQTYIDQFLPLSGGTITAGGSLILAHDGFLPLEAVAQEQLNAEAAQRTSADASLQGQINTLSGSPHPYIQGGIATILAGAGSLTFALPSAFLTSCDAVVVTLQDASLYTHGVNPIFAATIVNPGTITVSVPGSTPPSVAVVFNWMAVGH